MEREEKFALCMWDDFLFVCYQPYFFSLEKNIFFCILLIIHSHFPCFLGLWRFVALKAFINVWDMVFVY